MTRDSNAIAVFDLLNDADLLKTMIMNLSSDERRKQLHSIVVRIDSLALTSLVYIKMVIDQPGGPEMYYGTVQVSDFCMGFDPATVVQRCLKRMEQMVKEGRKC